MSTQSRSTCANVAVAEQGTHNVVYVATENNTIFAIDADSGKELFHTNLGPAVPKAQLVCADMGPQIGITGTPVIDPASQTLYVVAKTFENGHHRFSLHALDIASGRGKRGVHSIAATVPRTGTSDHDATAVFDPTPQLQRPAFGSYQRTTDRRVRLVLRSRQFPRLGLQVRCCESRDDRCFSHHPERNPRRHLAGGWDAGRRPPRFSCTSLPEMESSTSTMVARIMAIRF